MQADPQRPDLAEQLAKLSKMRADGALTDEEFKALKGRLNSGTSQITDENNYQSDNAPGWLTSLRGVSTDVKTLIAVAAVAFVFIIMFADTRSPEQKAAEQFANSLADIINAKSQDEKGAAFLKMLGGLRDKGYCNKRPTYYDHTWHQLCGQ